MIRINLLPQEEAPSQRRFRLPRVSSVVPLVAVLAVLACMALSYSYQTRKISELTDTIASEEAESRRLAPEIAKVQRLNREREEVNRRLDVITRLDRDRYFRVHLLDELNRNVPEHMWLTHFDESASGRFAVEGVTFSNFLVSDLMQNLGRSPYVAAVDLQVAERGLIEKVPVVKFKAQVTAARASGAALVEALESPDATAAEPSADAAPPAGDAAASSGKGGQRGTVQRAREVAGEPAARAASGQ